MTLHEAIQALLQETQRAMSTAEIATEINARQSYVKRDGSAVSAFQIHGRTRNYPQYFKRNGSMVSLITGSAKEKPARFDSANTSRSATRVPSRTSTETHNNISSRLLAPNAFLSAADIDGKVPDLPGIYAIRSQSRTALPGQCARLSLQGECNLLYIGVASKSLSRRFLGQELRARGHGTFFRSIGAVLGYRPEPGSLIGKGNTRNYIFSVADQEKIVSWINQNLVVNWITLPPEIQPETETRLIEEHLPLLNLRGNPAALPELKALRAECVDIANTPQ